MKERNMDSNKDNIFYKYTVIVVVSCYTRASSKQIVYHIKTLLYLFYIYVMKHGAARTRFLFLF